jgi:chromosome segregation ATPase
MRRGAARLTYPDLTEVLQARIFADLAAEKRAHMPRNRPDLHEHRRIGTLEAHIAMLEESIAKPEALGERRQREAETTAKRVKALDAHIAVLEEAVAKAKALGGQRRQETETAAKRGETLASYIAMLEEAAAKAEALGEQRRQEVETAAKRVEALEAHNAVLQEAVARAEVQGEQQRQKAETAAKRNDYLVAELIEMTNELFEMSKRMAEHMAATDRMRAELDDYRSRSSGRNAWQDDSVG